MPSYRDKPPEWGDMCVADLPARDMVSLQHAIEDHPEVPGEQWWELLEAVTKDRGVTPEQWFSALNRAPGTSEESSAALGNADENRAM